ncbi:MAG: hypothetical protein KY392_00530 [Chloroflexi bacterium]|nr:hypothetical protein [Chloroflexota bacterium]
MAGMLWITDREPGIRVLFAELLPEAEVLTPDELHSRLGIGQRPDAIVIDGTQLLELQPARRRTLLTLPRVLVCTGMSLASIPMNLVSGPGVAVLGKPFCVDDLEAAVEWVRGAPTQVSPENIGFGTVVQRRRVRSTRGRLPAR